MLLGVVPQNSSSPPLRSSARTFARGLQRSQPLWPTSTGCTVVVPAMIIWSRCLEERTAGAGQVVQWGGGGGVHLMSFGVFELL